MIFLTCYNLAHILPLLEKIMKDLTPAQQDLYDRLPLEKVKRLFPNWITKHQTAICGICMKDIKTSGNTSNTKKHLVKKHPDKITAILAGLRTISQVLATSVSI